MATDERKAVPDLMAALQASLGMATDERERLLPYEHTLSVVSSYRRPGCWVECLCGWASPDIAFPTDAEALAWARKEHGLDD